MRRRIIVHTCALIILVSLLSPVKTRALEIYVAPLAYQDDAGSEPVEQRHPSQDLLQRISRVELGQSVTVRGLNDSQQPAPRSFMDAAMLCESRGYPYLLYGFIKRTEYSYQAEVKLLSRESKEVAAAFIAGDDASHYDRLMDDLAAKIVTFVQVDLGMGPPRPSVQPARNTVTLPVSLGYWTPAGGGWSASMAGLVCVDASLRFVPTNPLYHLLGRPGFLALGLDAGYGLSMNQPGTENFFLHAVKVRLPVEAFLEMGAGHRLGIGLGPLLEIDTLVQSRLYGPTVTETTVTPGVSFLLVYKYALSNSVSLGIENILDVAFYAKPLVTYSPRLSVDFSFTQSSEGEVQ